MGSKLVQHLPNWSSRLVAVTLMTLKSALAQTNNGFEATQKQRAPKSEYQDNLWISDDLSVCNHPSVPSGPSGPSVLRATPGSLSANANMLMLRAAALPVNFLSAS